MKNIIIAGAITLALSSTTLIAETKKCTYTYNPKTTKLEWTSYKFTEKTAVKGTFDKIIVQKDRNKAKSIPSAMKGSMFRIATKDINSGVPERDEKIRNFFFGNGKGSRFLLGSFPEIEEATKGKARMSLTLNGITKSIPVVFETDSNKLLVKGSLDVNNFEMAPGIAKLNEVCKELHIGKDGISKLWSTVDFEIHSEFKTNCK